MKVLLREDVPDLGTAGELVEVADGYGRNYLIPRGLAVRATATSVKALRHQEKLREDRLNKLKGEAEAQAQRFGGVSLTIPVKAGEGDRLYGSVTTQDIEAALRREGITIDRRRLLLDEPIKSLGLYKVPVKLHPEVTAEVQVWVVKEGEEKS